MSKLPKVLHLNIAVRNKYTKEYLGRITKLDAIPTVEVEGTQYLPRDLEPVEDNV